MSSSRRSMRIKTNLNDKDFLQNDKTRTRSRSMINPSNISSKIKLGDAKIEEIINDSDDEFENDRVDKSFDSSKIIKNKHQSKSKKSTQSISIKRKLSDNSIDGFENDHSKSVLKNKNGKRKSHIPESKSKPSRVSCQKVTKKRSFKNIESNDICKDESDESKGIENEMNKVNVTPRRKSLRSKEMSNIRKSYVEYFKNETKYDSEEKDDSDAEFKIEKESDSDDSEISTDSSEPIYDDPIKKNITFTPKQKRVSKSIMETPSKALSSRLLRMSLTPCMQQRTASIVKPSTPLQEARIKLHVSILPKSLPCREEQFNNIYTFLHTRLSDKSGGCIYVSGVPGTGKTATVNEVIRCLKKAVDNGELDEFEYIDINGMKLTEPRQAYVQMLKHLTGQATSWEQAQKLLHSRFTSKSPKRCMTLLLVDELDLLCTKRQDVVYNILDWPSKVEAKLVVITIANTMDLPERILMGKVTSRLGLTRLTFPPYNHKQLEQIVVSRLKGYNAFKGETIELVARKVAAVSGDCRRALDICRRATEVAEYNKREMVSMVDVKHALDEMIASPKIQAIKHCSEFEKLFLKAVCTEVERTGVQEVVFKNIYFQFNLLCTYDGEEVPNVTQALSMCARLGAWGLLICDHSKMDIHQRVLLNVSTDDVYFATRAIET